MTKRKDEHGRAPRELESDPQAGKESGRAPGSVGRDDRQQGGGGQTYQTDKVGQHTGRQHKGGQDSH